MTVSGGYCRLDHFLTLLTISIAVVTLVQLFFVEEAVLVGVLGHMSLNHKLFGLSLLDALLFILALMCVSSTLHFRDLEFLSPVSHSHESFLSFAIFLVDRGEEITILATRRQRVALVPATMATLVS